MAATTILRSDRDRRSSHWRELARFVAVGCSGYLVNLATFALAHGGAGVDYRVAAVLAFLVAVTNNFCWNRHWTFKAGDGCARGQALRFVVVALAAFGLNLVVLDGLVRFLEVPALPAQALAIIVATPVNFLGNKLWCFRTPELALAPVPAMA